MVVPVASTPRCRKVAHSPNGFRTLVPLRRVLRSTASSGASTSTSTRALHASDTIPVSFRLTHQCSFGEVMKVVGSDPTLGSWDAASAPMMRWEEGHIWSLEATLPAGASLEFKLVKASGSGATWEPITGNRTLKVPKRLVADGDDTGGLSSVEISMAWATPTATRLAYLIQPADTTDSSPNSPSQSTAVEPPAQPQAPPAAAAVVAPVAPAVVAVAPPPAPTAVAAGAAPPPAPAGAAPAAAPPVAPPAANAAPPATEAPLDTPGAGALIQEPKPPKFRFKRVGSSEDLLASSSLSSIDLEPDSAPPAPASAPSPPSPTISTPPSASTSSSSLDESDLPIEAPPTLPPVFRFRRVEKESTADLEPESPLAAAQSDPDSGSPDPSLEDARKLLEAALSSEPPAPKPEPATEAAAPAAKPTSTPAAGRSTSSVDWSKSTFDPTLRERLEGLPPPTAPVEDPGLLGKVLGFFGVGKKAGLPTFAAEVPETPTSPPPSTSAFSTLPPTASVDEAKIEDEVEESVSASVDESLPVSLTGAELRQLVVDRFDRSYDVQLQRRARTMYLQVMWKHLDQASFPLTEAEYLDKLDAVAYCLTAWKVSGLAVKGIREAKGHPGYTVGGGARCISIPLGADLDMASVTQEVM